VAYIDEDGWLWPEPGDVLTVEHKPRPHDYGVIVGVAEWLVWHLSGNRIPEGCESSSCDGTDGMTKRIAEETARYYANGMLGRDGKFVQSVPFTHAAIHVAGSFKGKVINRVSNGIEVNNFGYAHADDGDFPGGRPIDPDREDARPHGNLTWEMLTFKQNTAIIEIADAWKRKTGRPVEDCLRGHHDIAPDSSHIDPGPELRDFLDGPVRAHLETIA
jgi:hypothetical protein